jgi:hypothetical protein
MAQINDVIPNISEADLAEIQKELGKGGTTPPADSSPAKQTVEEASPEESSQVAGTKSSVEPQKEQQSTSEGEKTPSTEQTSLKTRQRKVSDAVPYERFKEVNEALKKAREELAQLRSQVSPSVGYNELDAYGQPNPSVEEVVNKVVTEKVSEVLKPIITTLDQQKEEQEKQQALAKYPEAKKYEKEIDAYAEATNLTYEDIALLVLAKHSKPISATEKEKAEEEAREAELGGQSNSATRRSTTPKSLKDLSDEELEALISGG